MNRCLSDNGDEVVLLFILLLTSSDTVVHYLRYYTVPYLFISTEFTCSTAWTVPVVTVIGTWTCWARASIYKLNLLKALWFVAIVIFLFLFKQEIITRMWRMSRVLLKFTEFYYYLRNFYLVAREISFALGGLEHLWSSYRWEFVFS